MRAAMVCFLCLAGCTHTAYTLHGKVDVPATLTIREPADGFEVLATAHTAADGSFAVAIPADRDQPNAPVWLIVRAPGRATDLRYVGLVDEPVEVELREGITVTGRVVDPSGAPVRGARVFCGSRFQWPAPDLESTETDAEGRFRMAGIDPDFAYIGADHPAFEWNDAKAGRDGPVEVVLQPLKEVRGRVLAEGRPVAGARLCLGDAARPFCVTGADGRYRAWCKWDNEDDRVYHFRVVAAGFRVQVCLYDGEDIHLEPCAPFTGVVLAPDGAPVARATVALRGMDVRQECVTDAAGRFRFDAVPVHSALYDDELTVEKRGFLPFTREVELTDPPEAMTVRLARGARFTGRAVRDGRPVRGAEVDVTGALPDGGWNRRWAYTGDDGHFVLPAVQAGVDRLVVHAADDACRSETRFVSPREGAKYDLGDVDLHERLPLRGRIVDHLGRPVVGLELTCWPPYGENASALSAFTDASGRFEFPDLPVWLWSLRAGTEEHCLISDWVYPGDVLEYRLDPPE